MAIVTYNPQYITKSLKTFLHSQSSIYVGIAVNNVDNTPKENFIENHQKCIFPELIDLILWSTDKCINRTFW